MHKRCHQTEVVVTGADWGNGTCWPDKKYKMKNTRNTKCKVQEILNTKCSMQEILDSKYKKYKILNTRNTKWKKCEIQEILLWNTKYEILYKSKHHYSHWRKKS